MLTKKCFVFLKNLRDSHEEENDIYHQYHILIKEIHASKNKNEIIEAIEVLNDFNFYDEKNKKKVKKKHYLFFNQNQKILMSMGWSIGMVWGIIHIFENFLKNTQSLLHYSGLLLYFNIYGSFAGYLLACFIDHVQEKIDHTIRLNIFNDLEERLHAKINNFSKESIFMKSAILVL